MKSKKQRRKRQNLDSIMPKLLKQIPKGETMIIKQTEDGEIIDISITQKRQTVSYII